MKFSNHSILFSFEARRPMIDAIFSLHSLWYKGLSLCHITTSKHKVKCLKLYLLKKMPSQIIRRHLPDFVDLACWVFYSFPLVFFSALESSSVTNQFWLVPSRVRSFSRALSRSAYTALAARPIFSYFTAFASSSLFRAWWDSFFGEEFLDIFYQLQK